MNIHFRSLIRKTAPHFVKRADAGNIILCAGAFAALLSLTLPAFLKIYAHSASYISAAEYVYTLASSGTGSVLIAVSFCFAAAVSAAALIAGPGKAVSAAAGAAVLLCAIAVWTLHIPAAQIGFGIWLLFAGLAAVCAGIVRI
ncbi:MAG: hypothetical protein ACRCUT_02270 [Spirochaetota bacterium]